ncbi:UbiX family flavin prenyltransferase [Roseibium sp. LAB1]
MTRCKRLVIGVSGASGAIVALELLRLSRMLGLETFTTVSPAAERTIELELGDAARREIRDLATDEFVVSDISAPISSGSFQMDAMIVAPCSMRSLAAIAYGTGEGLLARAADVTLKERRPLVLLARESPLHEGHLEAMLKVTRMGAIVAPPVPPFYLGLSTLEDMTRQIAARALATAGIDPGSALRRWTGEAG